MNILKSSIFPTTVYGCNIFETIPNAQEVFDTTFDFIKKEELVKNYFPVYQSKDVALHKRSEYQPITNFIESILENIKLEGEYDTEQFSITEMWANKSHQNIQHPTHYHPNSYFSGVFYFTDGSPINFMDPVIHRVASLLFVDNKFHRPFRTHDVFPGLLIIFPSWLYHNTSPNTNEARWSMSFNCFPMGKTNYGKNSLPLCGLNLKDCSN